MTNPRRFFAALRAYHERSDAPEAGELVSAIDSEIAALDAASTPTAPTPAAPTSSSSDTVATSSTPVPPGGSMSASS